MKLQSKIDTFQSETKIAAEYGELPLKFIITYQWNLSTARNYVSTSKLLEWVFNIRIHNVDDQ